MRAEDPLPLPPLPRSVTALHSRNHQWKNRSSVPLAYDRRKVPVPWPPLEGRIPLDFQMSVFVPCAKM